MVDSNSASPAVKPSSSVKLVLLGEAAVGKSSLVLRYVSNDFQENKEPTIGAAFLTQKCPLETRIVKFEIWDTAGQERFASLAPMYYRNAQAALVVYDMTKPTSLIKAQHWVAELQKQASPGIVIALVGNKLDLAEATGRRGSGAAGEDQDNAADIGGEEEEEEEEDAEPLASTANRVPTQDARRYAKESGLLFFETSAKTGAQVQEVFRAIADAIPETQLKNQRAGGTGGRGAAHGGAQDESRVNLNLDPRQLGGGKEGCAC